MRRFRAILKSLGLLIILVTVAGVACAGTDSPGRHAEVNGIRMYYEIHGSGPPLILLHGGIGSGRQFAKQVPAFEKTHRVILPDACAQGRSTDRPGPLTYHAMAEDVVALMQKLHVSKADIMGWSDGGVVGLDLAMHHPDRVNHLVTFGANFQPDGLQPADVAWNDTATAADFGSDVLRDLKRDSPEPDHVEEALGKVITMWRTEPNFTVAELGTIRAKTMICGGEHDIVRRDHLEALAHAIPGGRLWIVPGASHSVIQEQPDLVNQQVLSFLRQ